MNVTYPLSVEDHTLLLIPCSKKKQCGSHLGRAPTIISSLSPSLQSALIEARNAISERALTDERTFLPAYIRYSGHLYQQGGASIGTAISSGRKILIVSGGYGLLSADESIGMYERRFKLSDWPHGLLEECILDYARRKCVRNVIAVMAKTSDYAKLIERINWEKAGLKATLVCPIANGGRPDREVPRAQGQAISALMLAGLDQKWISSDSLGLGIRNL